MTTRYVQLQETITVKSSTIAEHVDMMSTANLSVFGCQDKPVEGGLVGCQGEHVEGEPVGCWLDHPCLKLLEDKQYWEGRIFHWVTMA